MDLSNVREGSVPFWKASAKLWRGAEKACTTTSAGRLLALPVSVAADFITLSQIITLVGERTFKGAANIVAAPFTPKANALRGVKQLARLIPSILTLPLLPVAIAITNLASQCGILIGGAQYAKIRAEKYEDRTS